MPKFFASVSDDMPKLLLVKNLAFLRRDDRMIERPQLALGQSLRRHEPESFPQIMIGKLLFGIALDLPDKYILVGIAAQKMPSQLSGSASPVALDNH